MPVLTLSEPEAPGKIGLPPQPKEEANRVDFVPDKFVLALETKGYRLAWSRASYCPCTPTNDQSDQPDPNCSLCNGEGWLLFRPNAEPINERIIGDLDSLQYALVGDNSFVIRGVMTGIQAQHAAYEQTGPRLSGTAALTVRYENRLGFYDRLVNLDSVVVYSQVFNAGAANLTLPLRYRVRQMNLLRSLGMVFIEGTDFQIVDGLVLWFPGKAPLPGTRVAAHYLCHPTWRVIDHPHSTRTTPIRKKSPKSREVQLPISATVKLEWLI